jgi:hypothetical protein
MVGADGRGSGFDAEKLGQSLRALSSQKQEAAEIVTSTYRGNSMNRTQSAFRCAL